MLIHAGSVEDTYAFEINSLRRTLAAVERRLADKSAELDAVRRAAPGLYFRLDRDGRIVDGHGEEAELFGGSGGWLGRRLDEVLPFDAARAITRAADRARGERGVVTVEYAAPTPRGDRRFEARLVAWGDCDACVFVRSATPPRGAQAASRTSKDLRGLDAQKLEDLDWLAGGVAHDFNNLLTVILGRLQFLKRAAAWTQADRDHVEDAYEAASSALSLTRRLLAFRRDEAADG